MLVIWEISMFEARPQHFPHTNNITLSQAFHIIFPLEYILPQLQKLASRYERLKPSTFLQRKNMSFHGSSRPALSSHVPGTVPGTRTFPERGTAFMKNFYTKLFPEHSHSRSGTRNMEQGMWPRSTFPASMIGGRLRSITLCQSILILVGEIGTADANHHHTGGVRWAKFQAISLLTGTVISICH